MDRKAVVQELVVPGIGLLLTAVNARLGMSTVSTVIWVWTFCLFSVSARLSRLRRPHRRLIVVASVGYAALIAWAFSDGAGFSAWQLLPLVPFLIVFVLLFARRVECPDGSVLVIYGALPRGELFRVHTSGRHRVWSPAQSYALVPRGPFVVHDELSVVLRDDPAGLEAAAIHLIKLTPDEIQQRAASAVSGKDPSELDDALAAIGLQRSHCAR